MNHLNFRVIAVGLVVTLALAIPLAVFTDYYFYGGQLLQQVGEKFGIVQIKEPIPEQFKLAQDAPSDPDAIALPLDADDSVVPASFGEVKTEVNTDLPAWADGEPVVTGYSVTVQ